MTFNVSPGVSVTEFDWDPIVLAYTIDLEKKTITYKRLGKETNIPLEGNKVTIHGTYLSLEQEK